MMMKSIDQCLQPEGQITIINNHLLISKKMISGIKSRKVLTLSKETAVGSRKLVKRKILKIRNEGNKSLTEGLEVHTGLQGTPGKYLSATILHPACRNRQNCNAIIV